MKHFSYLAHLKVRQIIQDSSKYLTDIPRQQEEYEVIYGTRWNAECHIISILRTGVEYPFYFMTNSRYLFVTNKTNNPTQLRPNKMWPKWPVPYISLTGSSLGK